MGNMLVIYILTSTNQFRQLLEIQLYHFRRFEHIESATHINYNALLNEVIICQATGVPIRDFQYDVEFTRFYPFSLK